MYDSQKPICKYHHTFFVNTQVHTYTQTDLGFRRLPPALDLELLDAAASTVPALQ